MSGLLPSPPLSKKKKRLVVKGRLNDFAIVVVVDDDEESVMKVTANNNNKKKGHTICAGLSTFRCALNSALTYSSPSSRISCGRCRRCARRRRLYSGMGGSRAKGSGRRPPALAPAEVAEAKRRRAVGFIIVVVVVVADLVLLGSFFQLLPR